MVYGAAIGRSAPRCAASRRAATLQTRAPLASQDSARRSNARVHEMVRGGLLEEVRFLWQWRLLSSNARAAIGYKELCAYFDGQAAGFPTISSREKGVRRKRREEDELLQAIERIKINTRKFAKSQRTWLRKLLAHPEALTLDIEAGGSAGANEHVERVCDALGMGQEV